MRSSVDRCHCTVSVVGKISKAIIAKLLHSFPCTFSIGNVVNEMIVPAQQQAVEAMLHYQYINLCRDTTSIDSNHVNEIQVNTDSYSAVLSATFTRWNNSELHFNHGIVGKNCMLKTALSTTKMFFQMLRKNNMDIM